MIIVLIFVVILAFSYVNFYDRNQRRSPKEQQQVESQIKKQEEKKKRIKEEKKNISRQKEFIEKTATEKFGLLYPGEYLLKGSG